MKFGLLVMGYDIPSGLKFKLHNVLPQCQNMLYTTNMGYLQTRVSIKNYNKASFSCTLSKIKNLALNLNKYFF